LVVRDIPEKFMDREEKIKYWIKSANNDWIVAGHLFEKGDYSYALFFGHLTVEKFLKAVFVSKFNESPPLTHRLTYLAEKIGLELSPERQELLEIITDFNLEARYPDEKFSFYKKCTKKFTETNLKKVEEIKEWLLGHI
jgi:HEPN domain-containing protein